MESSSPRRTPLTSSHVSREKLIRKVISPAIRGKSCPICLTGLDERSAAVITVCKHAYCVECIRKWSSLKRKCPLCNAYFDSWFFSFNLKSRSYGKQRLPPLQQCKRENSQSRSAQIRHHRLLQRLREELDSASRRTRPLPWKRSFGQPGAVPPEAMTERKLQWRASIYSHGLEAVPLSSRSCLEQNRSLVYGAKERILQRIEPWIGRELQAILSDPDPSVIVHVATSLFIASLEGKFETSPGRGDVENDFLGPLRPFLQNQTKLFWHELRCFAESSLTMETYDSVVEYRQLDRVQKIEDGTAAS